MNLHALLLAPFVLAVAPEALAQVERALDVAPGGAAAANPVALTLLTPHGGENRERYGTAPTSLIAPEAAQALLRQFRERFADAGGPRVAIAVKPAKDGPGVPPEIERLFRRVFASAGAKVTVPGAMAGAKAAAGHADLVIEVRVASTPREGSKGSGGAEPEIRARAIRTGDAAVLAEAATDELRARQRAAGREVRRCEPHDLAEAAAFELIREMVAPK